VANKSTLGERTSDFFSKLVRSWGFVIFQMIMIVAWIILNTSLKMNHFDPYPFDGLKLILTIEASFMGSMILMNQYRQSSIDRNLTYKDFLVNWVAKREVDQILPLVRDDHRKMIEVLELLKKDKLPVDKTNV